MRPRRPHFRQGSLFPRLGAWPIALSLLLVGASAAPAATITVTTTADDVANEGVCSLREAIKAANTDAASGGAGGECQAGSGTDIVVVGAGTYLLDRVGGGENLNATGDLDITSNLTLDGAGSVSTTIDADGIDRVIDVATGTVVTIEGVTITGGRTPDRGTAANAVGGPGADGFGADGAFAERGGGIASSGTLTVADCRVVGNRTGRGGSGGQGTGGSGTSSGGAAGTGYSGNAQDGGAGGGIVSSGPLLTVVDSEISDNVTGDGGIGGSAVGGAGGDGAPGANTAGGAGGDGFGSGGGDGGSGGGIRSNGDLVVRGSTIANNTTGAGGRGGTGVGGSGGDGNGTGAGGDAGDGFGGGSGDGGAGGGISVGGDLTITDSTIERNDTGPGGAANFTVGLGGGDGGGGGGAGGDGGEAFGGDGGNGGAGGGLHAVSNGGPITGTTIAENTTGAGGAGAASSAGDGGDATAANGAGGAGGEGNPSAGGSGGHGAGIFVSFDPVAITNSTVSGNATGAGGDAGTAFGGDGGNGAGTGNGGNGGNGDGSRGGGGGDGGGIRTDEPSTLRHATLSGNHASPVAGAPTTGNGGAAGTGSPAGTAGADRNPTSTGAPGDGGGVSGPSAPDRPTLAATIVANNAPHNCDLVSDGGGNVSFPDTTCPGANADPRLGALADNGGPTRTHSLGSGSAALDAAGAGCEPIDQRGLPRPSGPACDSGAYEAQVGPVAPAAPPADAGTPAPGPGVVVGPPSTLPLADTTRPAFLSSSLRPSVFAVKTAGRRETPVAAARKGTTFRYRLSEAARVVFTIQRARPGRRSGGKCRAPTRANRKGKACTRWVRVGRFAQQASAAAMKKTFSGRIGTKRLKPGRHRASLVATDAAGNKSPAKRLKFRVVRR